jgi:ATP-dependent protease Clp ATPase subunit
MQAADVPCSFCGKRHPQIKRLVIGPGVAIYDECVELSAEIIHSGGGELPRSSGSPIGEIKKLRAKPSKR